MRISNWFETYETADTRRMKSLPWIRQDVQMGTLAWAKLWKRPDAAMVWAGWTAIVWFATQSEVRGEISSAEDVSLLTRVPMEMVNMAIEWALASGAITVDAMEQENPGDPQQNPVLRDETLRDETKENTREDAITEEQEADSIYKIYPKPGGKDMALKEIVRAIREVGAMEVRHATEAMAASYAKSPPEDQKFVQSAKNWFKDDGWRAWAAKAKKKPVERRPPPTLPELSKEEREANAAQLLELFNLDRSAA